MEIFVETQNELIYKHRNTSLYIVGISEEVNMNLTKVEVA